MKNVRNENSEIKQEGNSGKKEREILKTEEGNSEIKTKKALKKKEEENSKKRRRKA